MKQHIFNIKRIDGLWLVVENGMVIFIAPLLALAFDFITYSYDILGEV